MTLMASKKRVLDVCMIYKSDVNSLAGVHRIAELFLRNSFSRSLKEELRQAGLLHPFKLTLSNERADIAEA